MTKHSIKQPTRDTQKYVVHPQEEDYVHQKHEMLYLDLSGKIKCLEQKSGYLSHVQAIILAMYS